MIPVIILIFVIDFTQFATDSKVFATVIAMIVIFMCITLSREWASVIRTFTSARLELIEKFESCDTSSVDNVSKLEIIIFNLMEYHILSSTLRHFDAQKQHNFAGQSEEKDDMVVNALGIEMQNVSKDSNL